MGHGQFSLRRVLRAYAMYDSEVGYCQGMNFIAATFLTFLSEEEAFWLLVVVMNEEPYKLRDLFGEDMAGTHEVLYIAEKLMAQFLPNFGGQLVELGMTATVSWPLEYQLPPGATLQDKCDKIRELGETMIKPVNG